MSMLSVPPECWPIATMAYADPAETDTPGVKSTDVTGNAKPDDGQAGRLVEANVTEASGGPGTGSPPETEWMPMVTSPSAAAFGVQIAMSARSRTPVRPVVNVCPK